MSKDFMNLHNEYSEENNIDIDNFDHKEYSVRFSSFDNKKIKILVAITLLIAVIFAVIVGFDFDNTLTALHNANYWMLGLAVLCSIIPFFGASIALIAFSPTKLKLWDTVVMHIAGSVVSLVAPAGMGIIGVNIRFLYKHKLSLALSFASVIFTQIVQFFTTVLLIVVASIVTRSYSDFSLPWFWIALCILVFIFVGLCIIAYRPVYRWISCKISTYYLKVKPLFVWIFANPKRLFIGWVGTVIMTMGYASCFYFVLSAFTADVSFSLASFTFITANQVGSSVPSPGGIGGVELALSGALRLIGISTSIAVSTAVLYRVICFWIRLPFGWVASNYCIRKGLL